MLRAIADEKGSNPAQVAIAWALSRGGDIVPLIGARKRTQLQDALQAIEMQLTVNDIARIEAAVPPGRLPVSVIRPHRWRTSTASRAGAPHGE